MPCNPGHCSSLDPCCLRSCGVAADINTAGLMTVQLSSGSSGHTMCLDVAWSNTHNGAQLHQWNCGGKGTAHEQGAELSNTPLKPRLLPHHTQRKHGCGLLCQGVQPCIVGQATDHSPAAGPCSADGSNNAQVFNLVRLGSSPWYKVREAGVSAAVRVRAMCLCVSVCFCA